MLSNTRHNLRAKKAKKLFPPCLRASVPSCLRPAYTLVEVAVMLAVVAVVAAIALPKYGNSVRRYRLDSAASRISGDINQLRAAARSTSKTQSMSFAGAAGTTYSLSGVVGFDGTATAYSVNLAANPYLLTAVTPSFGSGALMTLSCDMYGVLDNSGTIVLQAGENQRTITVDASTGKVSVQ